MQKFNNPYRGNDNYLSHTVCDEFINLMRSEVEKFLIAEIQDPHKLTLILQNEYGNIKEIFFGFIKIKKHDAAHLDNFYWNHCKI